MSPHAKFVEDFHRHFTTNPNACVALGVNQRLDDLPDPSQQYAQSQADEAGALIDRLDTIDRSNLEFDDALDLELARLKLAAEQHDLTYTFNGRTQLQQMPTAGDDIGDGIFLMFINDPRPDEERLANITARLEKVPDYVEGMLDRLEEPVERWVNIDLEKVEGLPEFFRTLENWAEKVNWSDVGRIKTAREKAETALRQYTERLKQLPVTRQFHVGDEVTRGIVKRRGIELSLEELHAIAADFLRDTRSHLETLRDQLTKKYDLDSATSLDELHTFLNDRFQLDGVEEDLSKILDRYEQEREKILGFIQQRQLFPIPDDQDMKILRTPDFMAPSIPAGAMMSPPPFREGVRTSLVYLTLSQELLAEHHQLGIPNMMVHEGIPGHHLQLATASKHPSVIRRHIDASDHAEGWTTMLEDYMLDMGLVGELTDEARYIGKRDISRLGARVAIDLFFMTGDRKYLDVGVECDISSDNPFEAAGNLLAAVTGFTPGRVQAELNWYSQSRGYPLCYLTGNHLVWNLKRDIIAAQQGKLDGIELDREFHRVYLESGNMPVSFLRRVFQNCGMVA